MLRFTCLHEALEKILSKIFRLMWDKVKPYHQVNVASFSVWDAQGAPDPKETILGNSDPYEYPSTCNFSETNNNLLQFRHYMQYIQHVHS